MSLVFSLGIAFQRPTRAPAVGSPTAVPVSTAPPTITGSAVLGETLTASPGNWSNDPTGYAWQWLRGGTPIAGAWGQTYVLAATDLASVISVSVTATNAVGSTTAESAGTTTVTAAPVADTAPSITTAAYMTQVDGGATITYTFTPPVVAGNPVPTVARALTLNGVDVTGALSGNTYVATKTGGTQALVITYTASNGVSPNVTSTASATVPAFVEPDLFDFELLDQSGSIDITSVPNLRISIDGGAIFQALAAVPGHASLTIARHPDGDKLVISGWTGGTVPAGLRVHYEQAIPGEPNSAASNLTANLPALYARRAGGPAPVNPTIPGMTVAATHHNAPAGA